MKTTSYEISKKLSEVGFKADYDYCYKKDDENAGLWNKTFEVSCWEDEEINNYHPAYDLETMLLALPKSIPSNKYGLEHLFLDFEYNVIIYAAPGFYRLDCQIIEIIEKDESLADIAARLLLFLVEKEIIKFN